MTILKKFSVDFDQLLCSLEQGLGLGLGLDNAMITCGWTKDKSIKLGIFCHVCVPHKF